MKISSEPERQVRWQFSADEAETMVAGWLDVIITTSTFYPMTGSAMGPRFYELVGEMLDDKMRQSPASRVPNRHGLCAR